MVGGERRPGSHISSSIVAPADSLDSILIAAMRGARTAWSEGTGVAPGFEASIAYVLNKLGITSLPPSSVSTDHPTSLHCNYRGRAGPCGEGHHEHGEGSETYSTTTKSPSRQLAVHDLGPAHVHRRL